jgi:hypothetical protein
MPYLAYNKANRRAKYARDYRDVKHSIVKLTEE